MKTNSLPRIVTIAAYLLAIAAALYVIQIIYSPVIMPLLEVASPFVIAIILAFLLDPIVDWLEKRGLSRGLGAAAVGFSFLIVFVLLGFLIVPKIISQASALAANFPTYVKDAQHEINNILSGHKPLLTKMHLPTTTGEWTSRYSQQLQAAGNGVIDFFSSALSSVASRLLWIIIIPMSTLLILKDLDYIRKKIVHLTPERHQDTFVSLSSAIGAVFGKYIRGMMVVAILYSAVASIILSLFGLQYSLIIGAIAGLFYLVPYLGNVVIIGMTVITVLVQPPHSLATAGILALILAVLSMVIFDLFVTPRIVGGSVGVNPVLALFSLALGAKLFGVFGMVVAVPVVASLQVAIGQFFPLIYDTLPAPVPTASIDQAEEPST